jgi:hypothetical protein
VEVASHHARFRLTTFVRPEGDQTLVVTIGLPERYARSLAPEVRQVLASAHPTP